jgi:2'-5' RNA ligase
VRLFLAINFAPEMRRAVVDATAPLRESAPSLSWVDEARLHLTLKFLGEQPEASVEPLRDAMASVAGQHRSFRMSVREIGAFPNFRRARVVWMGVDREPRLEFLHHDVELACEKLGFELEGRPFRPHLTLARVKSRPDEDEMRKLSRAGKKVDFEAETVVRSIDLMRSNLDRAGAAAGARYERLYVAPLREN